MKIKSIKPVTIKHKGWLTERFGECWAPISTDVSLKLRSAVKDVARVMHGGTVPGDVEGFTKKFANAPQGISDHDFVFGYKGSDGSLVEGSLTTDPALIEYVSRYPNEWAIVSKCLGLQRTKSRHACAVVIADEPISNFIPLTSVGSDQVVVTQYTASSTDNSVEAVGGLKMDFLVINSLRDIAAAIKLIQARCGFINQDMMVNGEKVLAHEVVPFDGGFYNVWQLPEDQAVFRDFCEGKTETVFQFNTPGALQWLRNFDRVKETREDGTVVKALDSIEALSAFTALDRPGPLDYFVETPDGDKHNMLVEYARRAAGLTPIGEVKALMDILPETYGVIVYQEQLQKIFYTLGKTTLEEADEFRVHISKKQAAKVIEDKKVFMRGAVSAVGEETAIKIWESMETFAQYGFNKSHSICYSIIAYACAFLKHHFPLEWWCAVLRHADKDEISNVFWQHCGHLIDLPDVKLSGETFEIVNERIRAPLSILHGMGETAHAQLVKYRPYSDLKDFCEKIVKHQVDGTVMTKKTVRVVKDGVEVEEVVEKPQKGRNALNKGVISTLIVSGALESLFAPGTTLTDAVDQFTLAMVLAKGKKKITKADQFGDSIVGLNALAKYQMRKAVLPAYSEPCTPMIVENSGHPGVVPNDGAPFFRFSQDISAPFVSLQQLHHMDAKRPWPEDFSVDVAVAGYVMDVRKFNYGDGKAREALEITVGMDGGVYKSVRWAGKKEKLPENLRDAAALKGAIIVGHFRKFAEDRPFGVEDIVVVQPPLDHSKKEESGE